MHGMAAASVCVYCRQHPPDQRWQPFCSERCKLADLGHWLKGDYRVAGPPAGLAESGVDAGNDAGDDPP